MNAVIEMTESFDAAANAGDSDTPAPAAARGGDSAESASDETAQNVQLSVPV
jgi:hypothetical protein